VLPNDREESAGATDAGAATQGEPTGEQPATRLTTGRIVELDEVTVPPAVAPAHRTAGQEPRRDGTRRQGRAGRAGPLSRFLLVVALLVATGVVYLTAVRPDQVPVLVATRDLPAFHTITGEDVTLSTRDADDVKYAPLPVAGRLSLKPISKDTPLRQDDVSPDVASILGDDLSVHGFSVTAAAVLGDSLRPGDRIRLTLVREERLLARLDAVVLTVAGGDPNSSRTLVVAMKASDAKTHEVAISTGLVSVSKDPAAAGATG
jgi:hypothetical protein